MRRDLKAQHRKTMKRIKKSWEKKDKQSLDWRGKQPQKKVG